MRRRLAWLCLAGAMLLALGGCQGWEVGTRWLGDGGGDPDQRQALSDRGFGKAITRSVSTVRED